jgi:hypothetical protein
MLVSGKSFIKLPPDVRCVRPVHLTRTESDAEITEILIRIGRLCTKAICVCFIKVSTLKICMLNLKLKKNFD